MQSCESVIARLQCHRDPEFEDTQKTITTPIGSLRHIDLEILQDFCHINLRQSHRVTTHRRRNKRWGNRPHRLGVRCDHSSDAAKCCHHSTAKASARRGINAIARAHFLVLVYVEQDTRALDTCVDVRLGEDTWVRVCCAGLPPRSGNPTVP